MDIALIGKGHGGIQQDSRMRCTCDPAALAASTIYFPLKSMILLPPSQTQLASHLFCMDLQKLEKKNFFAIIVSRLPSSGANVIRQLTLQPAPFVLPIHLPSHGSKTNHEEAATTLLAVCGPSSLKSVAAVPC